MSGAGPISRPFVVYTNPIAGKRGAFLPDPMPLPPVSTWMMERLSNGRMTRIVKDSSFTDVQSTLPFGEVQFYHTTGRMAEVREALRRIIQGRMPLDEVEMIVPDEEYTLAISTMCASLGLSCSFADGLPAITSGMGRAAHFLLNWLESGYQVRPLVSIFAAAIDYVLRT